MKIDVKANGLMETKLRLAGLERKIKVVTKSALNDAAYLAKKKTEEAIGAVFDRPTPWIKKSVRYVKATADRLQAQIDFDAWGNKTGVTAEKVLEAEIYGGKRRHKRHEIALQKALILPQGYYVVPGEAADMDAYGNMKGAQIVQIVAWFRGFGRYSGDLKSMTDKTRDRLRKGGKKRQGFEYFYVPPGGRRSFQRDGGKSGSHAMQPGIYKRLYTGFGTAIRPVMIFVRAPQYKKRLDFYGIAERAAKAEFDRAFAKYARQILEERGL